MKKKNYLFVLPFVIMGTSYLSAQITLNQGSYPGSQIGVDTVAITEAVSTFPNLTPAANALWDMTKITDTTVKYWDSHIAPDWAEASYADYDFFGLSAYAYQANAENNVLSTGLTYYGRHVPRQAFSLAAVTGGPHDSLIFIYDNDSTYTYPSNSQTAYPVTEIAFPATYHSSWMSKYHETTRTELLVAAFAYNYAPTNIPFYVTRHDSVTGYGQMQVKNLAGDSSGWINVLQVQTVESSIDSFFINGTPAPTAVLTAFGVTQGEVSNNYFQSYYAAGFVTPLAYVNYSSNTFTTPKKATTMSSNWKTLGIPGITENMSNTTIYPNPNSGRFTVQSNVNGPSVIDIYNLLGEKIFSQPLTGAFGNSTVNMGSQPNGVYLYKMLTPDGNLIGQGKIVLQK